MKRLRHNKLAYGTKRPKAFIGAIIGAVAGIAGGIIGGISKKKAAKKQQKEEEARQRLEEDKSLTQSYTGSEKLQDEYELRYQQEFKAGGDIHIKPSKVGTFTTAAKKRGESVQGFASKVLANKDNYSSAMVKKANFAHNAAGWKHAVGGVEPIITEGGKAIPLNGRTSLLRGRTHKTGGIVIGKGENSIEAESGEVIENNGNEIKIFSAQPILNGESPAQLVVNGEDTNKVFNAQEQYKDMNGINDDGTKKSSRRLKNGGRRDLDTEIGQQQFEQFKSGMRQTRSKLTEPMKNNIGSNSDNIPSFNIQDNLGLPERKNVTNTPVGMNAKPKPSLQSTNNVSKPSSVPSQKPTTTKKVINNTIVQPETKMFETGLESQINKSTERIEPNYNVTTDFSKLPNGGVATSIGGKNYYFPNEEERDKFINKVNSVINNRKNSRNKTNTVNGTYTGKYRDYNRENGRFIRRGKTNRLQTTNNFGQIPQFRCGGRKKADYGTSITSDNWISSAISAAGSIAGGITNLVMTNKMKAPERPTLAGASKLQTNYNINPQLGSIERSRQSIIRGINKDTQSSTAALARRNRVLSDTAEQENILYGQKENVETQLLNQDALNQQQVRNYNVDKLNENSLRRQEFYNQRGANQANAINTITSGITGAATDLIAQGQQRYNENQQISAIIGSNEKNNLKYMIDAGYKPDRTQIEAALSSSTTQDEKDYYNKVLENLYGNKRSLRRRGRMYGINTNNNDNLLAN